MQDPDIIIAGAGLAAAITALRLSGQARVLLIDPAPTTNKTWSFHEHDVTPAIAHEWAGQDVRFPGHTRQLRTGYASITAQSLPLPEVLRETVTHIAPDHVIAGTRIDAPASSTPAA